MRKHYRAYNRSPFSLLMFAAVLVLAAAVLFLVRRQGALSGSVDALMAENRRLQEQESAMEAEIDALRRKKKLGRLSVEGTELLGPDGTPVRLKGISSHGLAWYPEYTNYRALKTIKGYGANVFRIALYPDQNDGYLEEPELNQKLLYQAVENSLAAGLYTIIDWHVLQDENPNRHLDEALAVFEETAKHYGDEPGILYEICNEPNGDTTYEDNAEYAGQVIPVIRKYAPNAVILVGTPGYCTSLSEAIRSPLPYENLMYTYHYYAGVSDCEFAVEEILRGLENGLPVFISEWGIDSHVQENGAWEETDVFLDFLDAQNLSWVNWSLCNKDEGYSLIGHEETGVSGWTLDELTPSGRYVVGRLQETGNVSETMLWGLRAQEMAWIAFAVMGLF